MSKKRSKLKPCDLSDEADPRDYLQDPELLKDKLPQPFRMLDNLLQDILYQSWERIELREVERAREAARVKIPEVSEWKRVIIAGDHDVGQVCLMVCSKGYVFAGGQHGVHVLRTAESGDLELVAVSGEMASELTSLDVAYNDGIHFIAAICSEEIKIFGLIKDNLAYLCSIFTQTKDQHYVAGYLSPSASHLGVAMSHSDSGMKLEFHKLPLESWNSQLNQFLEKVEAAKLATEEGERQQVNVQEELVYTKPVLLCLFHPPKGLSPCPTSDPSAAFQLVKDGCRDHLPTGNLHILTQKYFDNRKKAFLSQHPELSEDYDAEINYSNSLPTFHFIYYKNSCRQVQPCFVVIWWESHNQVLVYPLPSEPGKNAPSTVQLHWLLPQASPVVCSAISSDSKLLAVAQGSGVVTVWNFQTCFCESVSAVAPNPDSVSCLKFFNSDSMIGVGTEEGNVMALCTGKDRTQPPIALNQRIKRQMEEYGDLFKSSGYKKSGRIVSLEANSLLPSVLSSVHADGGVILWSSTEREALCKLSLPTSVTPHSCSYTSDGKKLLSFSDTTGEEDVSGLVTIDMTGSGVSPLLSRHWGKEREGEAGVEDELITGGFMELIERHLQGYIKTLRIAPHEEGSAERNEHLRSAELDTHTI